jgi:hypothetical protein
VERNETTNAPKKRTHKNATHLLKTRINGSTKASMIPSKTTIKASRRDMDHNPKTEKSYQADYKEWSSPKQQT